MLPKLCKSWIGSLNFVPNMRSKKSVQFGISLCFSDCYDEIFISIEEILIKVFEYFYFHQLMFMTLNYPDFRIFLEGELLLGRALLLGEIRYIGNPCFGTLIFCVIALC